MTIETGTRLGQYEIVALIGVGGMGEVYRATDSNLKRSVAIKVLPASVAGDAERVARFQREAEVLGALNHPHIAAIYGLEKSADFTALVMELVESEDLSQRIARGAIPLDEALPIAKQIAEALEAAHEQGIIHRDLKPANIKVRPDGTVKVLDFGLAKAMEPAVGSSPSLSMSPTITTPAMTMRGVILGTAAYMAPEQARGKAVDKRADIWAFGVVVYEMLTGQRAFKGEDISDTLAYIITKEPDWSALPADTPPAIHQLLRRCLAKDRKRRLADIADARFELDEAAQPAATPSGAGTAAAFEPTEPTGAAWLLPWVVAAIATAVAFAAILVGAPGRTIPPRTLLRLSADFGVNVSTNGPGSSIEISPDGTTIAFIGEGPNGPELFLRHLNQLTAMRVEGTRGAAEPFFSPDGQWIAYFAEGQLKKVSVNGGASVTLSNERDSRGGAWGEAGSIVLMHGPAAGSTTLGSTLYRISASGGKPEPLTTLIDGELTHRWPQLVNHAKAMLFTASQTLGAYEDAHIVVQQLSDGRRKTVVAAGYHGRYIASGHLVYMHAGTPLAMPFDLERLEATGPAAPAVEGVSASPRTAGADFAVSDNGTLVYIAGEGPATTTPIVWLDRQGRVEPLRTERANWNNLQFAPDGHRLAFDMRGTQADVWTYEWDRDTATQITFDPGDDTNPVWSPDGRYIAFASKRSGSAVPNLFVQRADGTGDAVRLTDSRTDPQTPSAWHPSGKFLAFTEIRPGTSQDVMILPLEADSVSGWKAGKPYPLLAGPSDEFDAAFSPDGRWLAYSSSESGTPDIYVRPFPGPGGKWKISTGAQFAVWSRSSRELFFRTADAHRLMVASYSVDGDSFRADKLQVWGEGVFGRPNEQRGFDLHPDGRRVAAAGGRQAEGQFRQDRAVFVFNFFDELRRIAPVTKR